MGLFIKKNSRTEYYVIQKLDKHGNTSFLQEKSVIPTHMTWGSDFAAERYMDMFHAKLAFKRVKATEKGSELIRLMLFDWKEKKYTNAVEHNNNK
jgi:hypothetical protein